MAHAGCWWLPWLQLFAPTRSWQWSHYHKRHLKGESLQTPSPPAASTWSSFHHLNKRWPQPATQLRFFPLWQYFTGISSLAPKWSALNIFSYKLFSLPLQLMDSLNELEGSSSCSKSPALQVNMGSTGFGYLTTLLLKPIVFILRLQEQQKK